MTGVHWPAHAHRWPVRVYYEDTDLAGIVYYANYLRFLERGRTEALRSLGIDQGRLKAETGVVFVVTRVALDYRQPAVFDDSLEVLTWVETRGAARVAMRQAVLRDGAVLCDGTVTVACMAPTGRPVRWPDAVRAALDRIAVKG